jgi:hypothetical protein
VRVGGGSRVAIGPNGNDGEGEYRDGRTPGALAGTARREPFRATLSGLAKHPTGISTLAP